MEVAQLIHGTLRSSTMFRSVKFRLSGSTVTNQAQITGTINVASPTNAVRNFQILCDLTCAWQVGVRSGAALAFSDDGIAYIFGERMNNDVLTYSDT